MRKHFWLFVALVLSFTLACASETKAPTEAAKARANAPSTTTTAPDKPVTVSPQVAALLAPDPDLDVTLSKEEIRATLEAAQRTAPPPPPTGPTLKGPSGEWQKMEGDQKRKNDEWKAYLQNTIVVSFEGTYHRHGCQSLRRTYVDRSNRERTTYVGSDTTLQGAFEQRLVRHAACGAPSYESHY